MPRKRKDSLPTGMVKRGRVYWADFVCHGQRIRKSLSSNLRTATQLLIDLRARAERAEFGLLDNDYAVEDLKTEYLRHCRQTLKPATVHRYENNLKAIVARLPPRVAQITVRSILDYRQRRLDEGISPRTINMDVNALATMLRWGVGLAKLIGSNPIKGLKPLRHDRPKEGRPLTADEVKSLLKASRPHWDGIWYAFLATGMRRNELASLTFADIDWEAREIIISRGVSKNHTARRIPIDAKLWDILCQQEAAKGLRRPGQGKTPEHTAKIKAKFTTDHVFTTTQCTPLTHESGLYNAFVRCCNRAGILTRSVDPEGREIDHVDVHSLRRTFATNLISNGADPKTVMELMGHKSLTMTMGLYVKMQVGTKWQAIGRLSYGAGVQPPDHVVQLPDREPIRHNIPTVTEKRATGST